MNHIKHYYLFPLLFLLSLNINAEEYKTGNLTQEEYQKVSDVKAEHMECMHETAIAQTEVQTDLRVAADFAMKECAPLLEELYNYLIGRNYAPEPMRHFVSSISNKAANGLLRNLMMFMAQKNSSN